MKKNKIFIACDTSNLDLVKKIIKQIKTEELEIIPKFGLQFFYSQKGRKFLEYFDKEFFLDLKINDIKQTAISAVDSLKDLKKCRYITVHANGGLEMLKAVKKKATKTNKNLKILGVTVLTSLNNKSLREIGHTKKLDQLVLKQAGLIKKAGLHGIVLSAKEAIIVKKKYEFNEIIYLAELIFEQNPYLLRKIKVSFNETNYTISFFNHSFNQDFRKNFFSLVDPLIIN